MRIVLANGVFDLLHPGHVEHLIAARMLGDFLIVSLTLDQFVNKGPNRPCFKWDDRARVLRELRSVDHVIPTACAVDAIRQVRPAVFVKGRDYLSGEFTENIAGALQEVGATLHITTTQKHSSTELLNRL